MAENVDEVAEFSYRAGGTAIGDGACATTCDDMLYLLRNPPAGSTPAAQESLLSGFLNSLQKPAKVWPPTNMLGTLALAGASFTTGVWIGDTVNDKLLHIGGPAAPASPEWTSWSLKWLNQGANVGSGATAPASGFYLMGSPGSDVSFKRWTGSTEGACSNLDPEPTGYTDLTVGEDACGLPGGKLGWRVLHAYLYETPLRVASIEDFEEDPYTIRIGDWPDEPQAMAELESRIEAIIENDELGEELGGFLATVIAPELWADPRTKLEEDHRCDRIPPLFGNPGGNDSPDEFTKKIETPLVITARPEGFGGTDVYLHWGRARWLPALEGYEKEFPYRDAWDGWGYRQIAAKHGWSFLDLEETEYVLTDDKSPDLQGGGKYRYEGTDIAKGVAGVSCKRVVVVDFVAGEGDPRPRGIVTSYNEVLK